MQLKELFIWYLMGIIFVLPSTFIIGLIQKRRQDCKGGIYFDPVAYEYYQLISFTWPVSLVWIFIHWFVGSWRKWRIRRVAKRCAKVHVDDLLKKKAEDENSKLLNVIKNQVSK